jgi:hypothetical protein
MLATVFVIDTAARAMAPLIESLSQVGNDDRIDTGWASLATLLTAGHRRVVALAVLIHRTPADAVIQTNCRTSGIAPVTIIETDPVRL